VTNLGRRLEIAQISAEKQIVMEMTSPHRPTAWRRVLLPVLALALAAVATSALAQPSGTALQAPSNALPLPPTPGGLSPGPTIMAPGGGISGPTAQAPFNLPPPTPAPPPPNVKAGEGVLQASARFGRDGAIIGGGLHWRIYADHPDQAGAFRLLREDNSAQPNFVLPAGGYIVHVSLGLASAAKPVQLRSETLRAVFDIPAGGLRIEGRVGNTRIPTGQISFDVFKGSQFEPGAGERRPMASGVLTGQVVLVPDGTYYILSKYGDGNAVVRSDIRVPAGKLIDITVTHRAAAIMFKLVSKRGGEALANTDWAVLSPAGDTITETKGAFPRVILAEGEYKIIARNDNKVYQQDLTVIPGVDGEIEVLAR
jgi:hypothetical protein